MPIGRFDRTPPPFFRQGTPALTKLVFFAALALFLMVADTRFTVTGPLRAAIATALLPIERTLRWPVDALATAHDQVGGLNDALRTAADAQARLLRQSVRASQVERLLQENLRLRALLGLRPALAVRTQAAEVLYEAPDVYARKVVIDRGAAEGIVAGSPVVDEAGVVGQVTRVYPFGAEVTLLTDRDAAIPVLNSRTGARGAAFGTAGSGGLELRFMAGNADVQVGDVLTTSGVDGVYPGGLPVARVTGVERSVDAGFAHVSLMPLAPTDDVRHVLVLQPLSMQLPARPEPEPVAASAPASTRPGRAKAAASGPASGAASGAGKSSVAHVAGASAPVSGAAPKTARATSESQNGRAVSASRVQR